MALKTMHTTRRCIKCGESTTMKVSVAKLRRWRSGEQTQSVWPEWSASKRELMITGTHPECWDQMFG